MVILEQQIDGVHVVSVVVNRIDAFATPDVRDAIMGVIRRGNRRFVLDLSGVDFLDSIGLAMLVGLFRLVGMSGRILVAGATKPVTSVMRVSGTASAFSTYETLREAVAVLR